MKWNNPTETPTYYSWRAMRQRCNKNPRYINKNITYVPSWESYDEFFGDMGERPEGTTLDRIDNSKGYYKENCRWATHRVQQNNKESLERICHEGVCLTIGEWCHKLGITGRRRNTVYKRHCTYGAFNFDELFTADRLFNLRLSKRDNKCLACTTTKTCKWRKNGTLCNTCWHKQYRATLVSERIDVV